MNDIARRMGPKMRQFAKFAVILAMTYLAQPTAAIKNESFHNTWMVNDEAKIFFAKNQFGEKDFFLFAVCDKTTKCYLTLPSMDKTANPSPDSKTCSLKIDLEPGKQFPKNNFFIELGYLVDSNKAVVSWDEVGSLDEEEPSVQKKVAIVDMLSCATKNLVFTFNLIRSKLASVQGYLKVYQNTFDVIISDKSKCGSFEKCRITFDKDGTQVGDVHPFPVDNKMAVRLDTVKPTSPKDGFFMVGYENILYGDGKLAARFVSESGESSEFSTDIKVSGDAAVPVSASHGLFTFCGVNYPFAWDGNSNISCSQYKQDSASPQLNVTFDHSNEIVSLALHNMNGGGFFLFALSCQGKSPNRDCKLIVDKSLPNGKKFKSFESSIDTQCDVSPDESLLKVEHLDQDNYCVYAACASKLASSPSSFDNLYRDLPVSQAANGKKHSLHWFKKCVDLEHAFE